MLALIAGTSRRKDFVLVPPVRVCSFCGADLPATSHRLRRYCGHTCREYAYRTRKKLAELQLMVR